MARPYSYHTFLFPFELVSMDAKEKSIKEVLNLEYWQELTGNHDVSFHSVIVREEEKGNSIKQDKRKDENTQEDKKIIQVVSYNQEQYFHENVKKAIHNDGTSNIVSEYVFRFQDENTEEAEGEKGHKKNRLYTIHSAQREYHLKVSNIRLKIFNTSIGMLILELYNDEYRDFKSVKEINELGRHISLPYISKYNEGISCAQKLEWKFLHQDSQEYSFQEKNELFTKENISKEKSYVIDFLKNIIIRKNLRPYFEVKPSLDDRMFTCCLVQNNALSCRFKMDYLAESEKNAEKYKEISKSLYEYVYIDKEGSCTAASYTFRKNILNESLYHRWTEWGTIYGASHTSFVAITGEEDNLEAMVIRPFLTQYVEIVILVLVQRASILRFQKQTAGNLNNNMIQELQSRYIDYRNQLHFFEVSSQEQGIELYELIRKQLYIEKEMEALEKNLEILYEKSNVDSSNNFNKFGLAIGCIAILSIILDLTSFIVNTKVDSPFCTQLCSLRSELSGIALLTAVISVLVWLFMFKWMGRRKKK